VEVFRRVYPREFQQGFLRHGVRADGRGAGEMRRTTASLGGLSSNTVGSAMVLRGRTNVVTGVTAEVVRPSQDSPDSGIVTGSVDFVLSVHSRSISSFGSVALQTHLRGLLESYVLPLINVSDLAIERGSLVWSLRVSVNCISHDGNLEDTVLLSALAALRSVRLPELSIIPSKGEGFNSLPVCALKDSNSIRAQTLPVSDSFVLPFSFALIGESILLDPTADEEEQSDALVHVFLRSSGLVCGVLSVPRQTGNTVPKETLAICAERSQATLPELRVLLDSVQLDLRS